MPCPAQELHRAHLVEEDERADHLAFGLRQRAADREAAKVAHARHDDEFQRVAGCVSPRTGSFDGSQLMVSLLGWRLARGQSVGQDAGRAS